MQPSLNSTLGAAVAAGVILAAFAAPPAVSAQTVTVLRGVVRDTAGGVLPGASIRLTTRLTGFERGTTTAPDGSFDFTGLPLDAYDLTTDFPGFASDVRRLDLRTSVPTVVEIVLEMTPQEASVTVTPGAPPLVDPTATGTRTQVGAALVERLPTAIGSRGLESVLVTFPGFAQNANGAIHPRGAHNQMTYVVDGLPISDQLTGAFANSLDAGIVQAADVTTGNVPAEFGSKVSGVAVITSRSGLGLDRRLAGEATVAVAGFGTRQAALQVGGGTQGFGYFGSINAMRTERFLDQVSLDNLHNDGHHARGFFRADLRLGDRDFVRLHAMGGRSSFEIANLRSQEASGQDQRQSLGDLAGWASHLRTVDPESTMESILGYRVATARLDPSGGDAPVTAAQRRRLATLTASVRYTRVFGQHMLRAGADVQRFPLDETFSMAITDPAFNDPRSDAFNPALLAHDLTRGGVPFGFRDAQSGSLASGFLQVTLRPGPMTLTLGARHDVYAFLVRAQQLQPRIGIAYQLPRSMGVVRASYNRNLQTPPNENLLLSSSEAASALAPDSVRQALGDTFRPIHAERQDVYEVGFQRALGGLARLDVSAYRKRSTDQQDNNNFFDTGIIFPTTLAALAVDGAELRIAFPPRAGASGTLSATMGRAVATPPFTGGLFLGQDAVDLLSSGPFRIDHDQRLSVHATAQYQRPAGWWIGGSIRYDSGLVANPSDPAVVAADPDFADLLPYVDLEASVPRVRPRTVVDVAAGYDLRSGSQRTWSVQLQVTNLANATALYNFQSVFVGTRLVQPRTVAVRVKRYF